MTILGPRGESRRVRIRYTRIPALNCCSLTFHKIKKFTKRIKTSFTSLEDDLSLFANQVSTQNYIYI